MSLKAVEMWTVVCDECGRGAFEDDVIVAWSDKDGALESFGDSDWSSHPSELLHRCPDHNPFCENCGKDAGELCGERDFMCSSCFAAVPA